ncbi:MAG: FHA domain-containing protein [Bacteroidales bacterium]|nr:FHA domain-containing protein [Bacteroidales bacterium]
MKVITIGRDSASNEIAISDPKASRTHLQLVMDDNGNIFVVDLNSTNGTFINGQRITGQAPLHPGDDLRIGDTSLPWLNYLQTSPVRTPLATPASGPQNSSNGQGGGKKKALIWIIVASAVVLIALGIGLVMLFNNGGNTPDGSESEYTPEPGKTIVDVDVEQGIEVKPDPKETKKPTKPQDLQNTYDSLRKELSDKKNNDWLKAVKESLDVIGLQALDDKFKNADDKGKANIIKTIERLRPKNTPDTKSKVIEARFEALCDSLVKNNEWKDTVLKLYRVKDIVGLRATFSAMNNTDRENMVMAINSLRGYKKSAGGTNNGTGGNENGTSGSGGGTSEKGNGASSSGNGSGNTSVNGSGNVNTTNNLDNTFNKLLDKMNETQAEKFCKFYYNQYGINQAFGQKYRDLLKNYYYSSTSQKGIKTTLVRDMKDYLGIDNLD